MEKISKSLILATFLLLVVSISAVCAVSDSDVLSISNDDSGISSLYHPDVLSSSDDGEDDEDLEDDWDDDEEYDDDEDWDEDDGDDEDWDDDEDYGDSELDEDGESYGEYDGNMTYLSSSASIGGAKAINATGESESHKIDLTYPTGSPIVVLFFSLLLLIMIPFRNR